MSLDFEKALESPQFPSLMMLCKNSELDKPLWLNNDSVALLQKKSTRWILTNYSTSKNKSTDLYDIKGGNLIDFTYSATKDLIAVISIHNDGQHYIEMLKPNGDILSSHLIQRPKEISKFRFIHPSFDPLNKQLIFSTGRQLFTLSYDGNIDQITLPFGEQMWHPNFHPNGKKLLMITGSHDSDIALIPLNQPAQTNPLSQTKQNQTHLSLERSILAEDSAIFQPGGELIAFLSERSGEAQLWITNGTGPQQLTHFPADTNINGIDWSADGKSILVNGNGILAQVFLDSSVKFFPFEYPVIGFFQWNSEDNTTLLITRIKGILKFVEYNLNNSQIRELTDKKIEWALKSEDGRLIYKDHMDRFWQPGPAEAQPINQLDSQGGSKRFVIKDNMVFGINSKNRLWSYDLNIGTFEILRELPEQVAYLSDINETHILVTLSLSSKKEVVELSLSE